MNPEQAAPAASPIMQAMNASKQHQHADDLVASMQANAADFQAELIQSIMDVTRGDGYERKTHLAQLLPLRRGMEIVGQGSPIDIRNTILIVMQLRALVWAAETLAKSPNPLERSCYDWRQHMELVTAFNVETGILQNQLAFQASTRSFN